MRHRPGTVNGARTPCTDTVTLCYALTMEYVEEREFLLRLEVRCPFPA